MSIIGDIRRGNISPHVEVDPQTGCWNWKHSRDKYGYGWVDKRKATAVVWELDSTSVPPGMCVCHSCDNPSCINPDHLFIATQRENIQDRHAKGRSRGAVGVRNSSAKLTENAVREIRKLHATGEWTQAKLGAKFDVGDVVISNIVNRKNWKHVRVRKPRRREQ